MKNTGLTEQEWQVIRKNLQAIPKIEKAVLFGSRAMGLARSNSDVDILLYGNELTLHDVATIKNAFEETTLPYGFDVILYDANNTALLSHINDYGQVIFDKGNVGWKEVRLGDVCVIKYGKDHKSLADGAVPVYGSGGIMRYVNTSIHNKKSVLIPRKGTLGNLFLVNPPFWTVDTIFWSDIDTEKIDANFLYYNLHTKNLAELNVGTAVPSLTTSLLNDVEINLPPLDEQKRIASILSSLDDKIENNNLINKNLEEQAQAIFKSWFIDFEPFKDGEFEDSELGRIPKGWRVGTLGDYVKIKSGYAFKSTWWQDKGVKVLKIKNITNNGINLQDVSYVLQEKMSMAKEFLVTGGDLLIAMTGATIGKFAIVPHTNEPLLVNQRVGKFFLGDDPVVRLPFIWSMLKKDAILEEIINRGQGSAQPNISPTDIQTIKIPYPTEDIIPNFNIQLSPIFRMILQNQQEVQKLTELRDTLLPKLMSGEVRVPVEVE